ncbi:MAG TPA: hypothetical protein VHN15_03245 [Thermoanaerobaculia bacterium]|nr:hypothetical protein [Thermoanaerobaculia bacterium]
MRRLQRRHPIRNEGQSGRRWGAAVPLLLAAFLAACGSAGPVPTQRPVDRPQTSQPTSLEIAKAEQPYLIDPLTGFAQEGSSLSEPEEEVRRAWRRLFDESDLAGARETAAELLASDPGFPPAQVLAAQVDFVEERFAEVVERLRPIGEALPSYTASRLLLARAAEKQGDVPLAYEVYRALATRNQLAFQRTGDLHPRALEILYNRLNEALRASDLETAARHLASLQAWAPAEMVTLEAARNLAVAQGDLPGELAAVKSLAARRPEDRDLLERRAELEMTVGDPSAGLEIIQGLAARNPNDPRLAEMLDAAKFRWRLTLLPQAVQQTAVKPELNRADLATLLYWLVPNVRYARPAAGRIATDAIDHPRQEEIIRVVNLGLMDVDGTLHRFSPGAPVRRGVALRSLVRMLGQFGTGISCLGGGGSPCETAARCALVSAEEGCQAQAPLSGAEAVDLIRKSLDLLGAT